MSVRALKFNCLEPFKTTVGFPVTVGYFKSENRHFTTTLASLSKVRKQIKNKNLKKDPNFKPWEVRIGSHAKKFLKHHKKTRDIDLWNRITLQELSNQLELDVDDVMDVILSLKDVNTDHIDSEHSEISDTKIWNSLANKLHFKYRVTENPNNKQEKANVDKDVYKDPPASVDDMTGDVPHRRLPALRR